jgi:hypothetical protein
MFRHHEEPARFIRYAALGSIIPNSPFSKVVQNNILYTYSGMILKDFVHQCKVLDISTVFSMKMPQDAHIDDVFLCQNPVENCTQISRDATSTDVMTSFGMIDRSAVFCVIMRAGSSLTSTSEMRLIVNFLTDITTLPPAS